MNLTKNDCPTLISGLYNGNVDSDIFYYYNPKGYGNIVTLDKEMQDVLAMSDGNKTIHEIASELKLDEDELTQNIQILVNKEIVTVGNAVRKTENMSKKLDVWLHVTNDCTLDCKYCYINKCKGDMPFELAKQSIDKLLASCRASNKEELVVRFAGGEPTMKLDFLKQIVDYTKNVCGDIKPRFVVLTNGTLISDKFIDFVKAEKITIGISLDGIEEYNDKNRYFKSGKGSYKVVIDNINKLLKSGIRPGIMTTVTNENLDGLKELTAKMIEMGLHFRFSLERDIQTGNPSILQNQDLVIEKINECIQMMMNAVNSGNTKFSFQIGDVYFHRPAKRSCGAASCSCSIGNDGKIGICGMGLSVAFTNLDKTDDLMEDVRKYNEELLKVSSDAIEECSSCPWRYSCSNGCPLQTKATYGTYRHVSPYCRIYKETIPNVVKLYALRTYKQLCE